MPLGVWFRGGLTDIFADVLGSPRARQRGYFEPAFVDRLVHEHLLAGATTPSGSGSC